MAHVLSITNGATTISLSTSNVLLQQYVPATPEIDSTRNASLADGVPVDMPVYRNVTETIEIMLENSSKTSLQSQVTSINLLLNDAKRRQTTKTGARVYLQLQIDGESDTWRSEIFTGRLVLDQDALRHYANIKVQAALIIERAYYWEGSQVELQLSTSNASAATGGRTVHNHDDNGAGHDNWVQIAAAQVKGDLPTPARLTLINNSGASQTFWHFHIGTNAYSDPANFTHVVEGESAVSGGTTTGDANSSGGNFRRFTVNTTATGQWTIAGAQLQKADGRYFRLLARFADVVGNCYIQPKLRDNTGLIDIWTGDEVYIDTDVKIADLGSIPLPPSSAYGVSWSDMRLYLSMRSSASCTLDLDFIQLTPTDSYAQFTQLGLTIPNSGVITVDGIEGAIHAAGFPIYTSALPTVWLFPNKLQRLIFLHNETTGAPSIANTLSVRAYVRPRRLTI